MSAGLHIGFSFQFQFTVVSLIATKGTEVTESRAAVPDGERLYLFGSMIRTDIWVVKGGGKGQTEFAGFGLGRSVDGRVGCQPINGVILGVASHSNAATGNLGE